MKLHIGQGTAVGAITVFPVWHDGHVRSLRIYDTASASLTVTEADTGPSVPTLQVTNSGEKPVLVLDGQLFEEGMQHRMATRSTLVRAGGAMPIEVACVEQSRWAGATTQATRGRRANLVVRDGYGAGGQEEVWRRIASYDAIAGRVSRTGSLAERLDTASADEQAKVLSAAVRPIGGQCGVLIGVGGQPLLLEVFDHPTTLREQLRPLYRAAALDAYGAPALPTPARRARRFAERLAQVQLDLEPDVGQMGRLGRATNEHLDVAELRHRLSTVHLRASYRRHPLLQAV
ncbi:ARPP-1 family domain-containing protein [Nocardioides euryhalodurans]|uniref:ARG and Rhodanese-Phosphatase-superfamily-associated domain-containing protein n=1 Tax=Nocardioides euryhalodurans TaxID=2518370 RepID=A0A4P7GJD1_9ACTN|nr:DUF6569 family protein [Nocardioides euryhalodurans]QBR91834.1 hypothetical protein EXE57_05755 [Nocardioides euryhalodurans]